MDYFQTIAWFNSVVDGTGDDSTFRLEKRFQPENVKRRDGKLEASRAWDKYRDGTHLPNDGYKKDGRPGPVVAAGMVIPESLYIYRHPIWRAMRAERLSFEEVVGLLTFFPPFVSRYYLNLETRDRDRQFEAFSDNVGQEIWIDREDDPDRSLDHLAIHLMILKMDNFRHVRARFQVIAENIAKTLGPLSISPWFGPIHEELYDWLELNIWRDIFDRHYPHGSQSVRGWRKCHPRWLLPHWFIP